MGRLEYLDEIPQQKNKTNKGRVEFEPTLVEKLANSPLINAILGAGEGFKKVFTAGYEPEALFPKEIAAEPGISKTVGEIGGTAIGSLLPFGMLGSGLRVARGATAIPEVAKIAEFLLKSEQLPSSVKNIMQASALGGLISPEDRLKGAVSGAAMGGLGELAGLPSAGYSSLKTGIIRKPVKEGAKIFDEMIGEGQSYGENVTETVSQIRNTRKKTFAKSAEKYKTNLFDTYGKDKLSSQAIKVPDSTINAFGTELNDQYTKLLADPTVENAHFLQSAIGDEIASIEQVPKSMRVNPRETREELIALRNGEKIITKAVENHFQNVSPEVFNRYQEATDFYKKYARPWKINQTIEKVTHKNPKIRETVTPTKMLAAFKNPEIKGESIAEIRNQINQEYPNFDKNILHLAIGPKETLTPDKLINEIRGMEKKGLKSYVPQELIEKMEGLETSSLTSEKRLDALRKVMHASVGGLLGKGLGIPGAGYVGMGLGALVPQILRPSAMKYFRPVPKADLSMANLLKRLLVSTGLVYNPTEES